MKLFDIGTEIDNARVELDHQEQMGDAMERLAALSDAVHNGWRKGDPKPEEANQK